MYIKVGDSETKEGLRVDEATGGRLSGTRLWLPTNKKGVTLKQGS